MADRVTVNATTGISPEYLVPPIVSPPDVSLSLRNGRSGRRSMVRRGCGAKWGSGIGSGDEQVRRGSDR